MTEITIWPVPGLPEVRPGHDLGALIVAAVSADRPLRAGDIVVVTHKVVAKAEGRLVNLRTITPSVQASEFAARWDKDPRQVEVVLQQAVRVVRMERGVIITETAHGFVCANAGVDASNIPGQDIVCLLPENPDATARTLSAALTAAFGVHLPVIIADSFGRPWRLGITNVAIGVAGMTPLTDYRGQTDPYGYELAVSVMATADELAAAAELVMGKTDGHPVAVIRGYPYLAGAGSGRDLVMDASRDLFR
jgi:coenzyme F420-0:L-glutamate ligase/coenzyme F420-1:gamma-L-glutamate ligase